MDKALKLMRVQHKTLPRHKVMCVQTGEVALIADWAARLAQARNVEPGSVYQAFMAAFRLRAGWLYGLQFARVCSGCEKRDCRLDDAHHG